MSKLLVQFDLVVSDILFQSSGLVETAFFIFIPRCCPWKSALKRVSICCFLLNAFSHLGISKTMANLGGTIAQH